MSIYKIIKFTKMKDVSDHILQLFEWIDQIPARALIKYYGRHNYKPSFIYSVEQFKKQSLTENNSIVDRSFWYW